MNSIARAASASYRQVAQLVTIFVTVLQPVAALPQDSRQIENIRKAAHEVASVEKDKGYMGALVFVQRCYLRELKTARSITPGLETCMAQDIIESRVAAASLNAVSKQYGGDKGPITPERIMSNMSRNVAGIFEKFNVPEAKAREFVRLVTEHGTDAYGRARYPEKFR